MKETVTPKHLPPHKERIEARKRLLQARADGHTLQLQHGAKYLVSETPSLLKREVVDKVADSSPLLGKILGSVIGVEAKSEKKDEPTITPIRSRTKKDVNDVATSPLQRVSRTISTYVLPVIYTIGTSRLLSYSLRSAGSLIRNGAKRLFGCRKKKRR